MAAIRSAMPAIAAEVATISFCTATTISVAVRRRYGTLSVAAIDYYGFFPHQSPQPRGALNRMLG